MPNNVVLVDYGCGNLLSIANAVRQCGKKVILSECPHTILRAERLILPGVGAFGHCISTLKKKGLFCILKEYLQKDRPTLGICVGMQMLLQKSFEHGEHEGLGFIAGAVHKLASDPYYAQKKIPFIGWAQLSLTALQIDTLNLHRFAQQWFYFVHSFVAKPTIPSQTLAEYHYFNEKIPALIAQGHVIGCQFHPEKSGPIGLAFLQHFLSL